MVGAGQAGLAMSYHLRRLGREHLVIERGRIAERWRSERWDSLMFQFPNWMLRLPGHAYSGNAPDGFMPRDSVVRFLEDYARRVAPPIRCGVRVTRLGCPNEGRLRVETDHGEIEAANVVAATGAYQRPSVPPLSASLPPRLFQVTANCYTNPAQLPAGNVLVVGSGGSGCQIADDLARSGRGVFLCVGRHRRVPRRYRGKDFGWWQEKTGAADRVVDPRLSVPRPPLLTGVDGGYDVDLRRLASRGVRLLGSLAGVNDGVLHFAPDLRRNVAEGDAGFDEFTRGIDAFIEMEGMAAPREAADDVAPAARGIGESIPHLALASASIKAVVWATGYRYDFGWIQCGALGADGKPVHSRGVGSVPGLYFLGLPRLHKLKSAFLWGVGEDAAHIGERIAARK